MVDCTAPQALDLAQQRSATEALEAALQVAQEELRRATAELEWVGQQHGGGV